MSSAVDEDTAKAINSGRETIGTLLSGAQANVQKIFLVFVAGFLGSFYVLRLWVWSFLEATTESKMADHVAEQTDLITRTPFEVILLQAKIGAVVGIILVIPAALYYSRDALRRRGFTSVVPVSKLYAAGFVSMAIGLFVVGIVYAYNVFFPYMFEFLARNAIQAGVKPSFGITEFTQFVALLTISFGLAAQLPLFMGALAYTEVVSYETFRDKWRHAILAIFVFGALFSPPEPFTQVMWAIPLIVLYTFSLGLAKLLTNVRRRGSTAAVGGTGLVKRRALQFVGSMAVVTVAATAAIQAGLYDRADEELSAILPGSLQPSEPTILGVLVHDHGLLGDVAASLLLAAVVGMFVLLAFAIKVLQDPVHPRMDSLASGDPAEIDLSTLDAEAIDAAPPQVFLEMDEDDAMDHAREAMYDEDKEKAQAILDRFDTLQATKAAETDDAEGEGRDDAAGDGATDAEDGADAPDEDPGGLFSSTAAGVMDAFTDEETTEEDIGGYAYDLVFIYQSLTSKMFRLVGTFMVVMGAVFVALYSGGLGVILEQFVDRVPEELLLEIAERNGANLDEIDGITDLIAEGDFVIALHPVEVLIFEVKVSVIAGVVVTLPMLLYYAWPALKERGIARGDRRTFLVWGVGLAVGFLAGIALGFFWIAPAVISYLITDAVNSGMVVSYQISHFFWMVIFTTIGIGFLLNVIVTMALFHLGGIVPYRTMLRGWRVVVIAIFAVAALATPSGILTMLLLSIPLAFTYLLGLAVLYVLTGGGRLFGGEGGGGPNVETGLFGR